MTKKEIADDREEKGGEKVKKRVIIRWEKEDLKEKEELE